MPEYTATGLFPRPESDRIQGTRNMYARVQGGNAQSQETARYVAAGLPQNYESMATAYALKYGREQLITELAKIKSGSMTLPEMRQLEQRMSQAAKEFDDMYSREKSIWALK